MWRLTFWRGMMVVVGLALSLMGGSHVVSATSTTGATTSTTVHAPDPDASAISESDVRASDTERSDGHYERAVVERVELKSHDTSSTGQLVEVYDIRFLSGLEKNQQKTITNDVGSNPYGLQPRVGDKVVIFIQPGPEGQLAYYIEGYDRRVAMMWLVLFFVLTMILLSGWQGVKITFSIFLSLILIGYVLIPLFLQGYHPVPVAILLAGLLTFISTGLSTGWNKKSFVTAIGTIGGTLVAFGISSIFANWAHLQGVSTEEDRLFFNKNPHLNPQALLFAGIIIASAGVVEDVAVSIASGVAEVRRANPRARFRELFRSGMVIGNDHMGALANTLVYVYVGGSLSTLLLYKQFGGSWLKFVNFDSVVDEIVRSLSGTIGLVFTVPITALLASWLLHQEQRSRAHVSTVPKDMGTDM